MSVRPVAFRRVGPGVSITIQHDELQHQDTVGLSTLDITPSNFGSETLAFDIVCPVCGGGSTHPAGGGVDARRVQFLFALIILRRRRQVDPTVTFAQVKAWLRARVDETEGRDRWRIETAEPDDSMENGTV
jgi:hypothetical protein